MVHKTGSGENWNAMAVAKSTDWKNSRLYRSLVDQVNAHNSFEDLVDRGVLGWQGDRDGLRKR